MRYSSRFKMLFQCSPAWQIAIGRFDGYMLLFEEYSFALIKDSLHCVFNDVLELDETITFMY